MEKIAITVGSFGEYDRSPLKMLENEGYKVILNNLKRKLDKDEVLKMCAGCTGIIAGTETYDNNILERLSGLKVISRCGTGLDGIDMDSAKKRGIKVMNTPDSPTSAVAELAVGAMIGMLRQIPRMDRAMRAGVWDKRMGSLLCGKRVGIIGFGRIGQKVGELLSLFGVELAYCDIEAKSCHYKCMRKTMDELLAWADILSLHVSGVKEHSIFIGEKELKAMRRGSWIMNFSRGTVLDEIALLSALKSGHLAGAALDVFKEEPYKGPLAEQDNVIITPHIGSYAKEARIAMEIEAAKNVSMALKDNP